MSGPNRILLLCPVLVALGVPFAGGAKPVASPLSEGPMHYFEARCTRCHGKVDSPANTAYDTQLSDKDLRTEMQIMTEGPGGAPLSGAAFDAQVALARAMIDKRPFLAWTGWKGRVLTGEAVAGSVVGVKLHGRVLPATLTRFTWTVRLPDGTQPSSAVVVAKLAGRELRLDLSKTAYTGGARQNK